jgi:hypothetical protein
MSGNIFDKSSGNSKFILSNGEEINTIRDLYKKLKSMDDSIFTHHVNQEKNDFSTWLKDVFKEKAFADYLVRIKDKKEMRKAIGEWIAAIIHNKHQIRKTNNKKLHKKTTKTHKKRHAHTNITREDLKDLERPSHILSGILDFVIGFIVGAIAMIILLKLL